MTSSLTVRVQPGARRSALLAQLASGEWKLAVTAPPEDGRANEAVILLVAGLLGLKRRQVSVARGHSSRSKTLAIEGLSDAQVAALLNAHLTTEGHTDAHGE